MDLVFERVEELLCQGDFGACDELLRVVDLKRLDSSLILTFVSVTFAAREELPWRGRFVQRAEARLKELVPDRVERLLKGLR